MKRLLVVIAAGLALLGSAPGLCLERVRVIIGANAGGGYDLTGRGIGEALLEAGAAQTVQYENRGGAGGTVALAHFVSASRGDPGALIVTGAVMVGAIVQNKPPVSLQEATPIARLLEEYNVFVVPRASPIRTMQDVVERLRKDPGSVRWGGGSRGSVDHISVALIAREAGVEPGTINYVPFQGGGEAAAAILGGHVTVGTSGYAELAPFIRDGRLRALAVTSEHRLPGIPIPTLKELGLDVVIGNWRGVYGAPGLSAEERRALVEAVVQATRRPAWTRTLKQHDWFASVLTGDAFGRFVAAEHARIADLMRQTGMVK